MLDLSPEEIVRLSVACLQSSDPPASASDRMRWRKAAAAAFYQAGVERHRRLFASEIIADFEAAGLHRDPAHAARERGLVDEIDDATREQVARFYGAAIAYASDLAEPLYNLATLRRNAGRLDEASALFMRAAAARPHPRAAPHAFVTANAFWEAACIAMDRHRFDEAEALFRQALQLLDNFGPDHVRFPRLLQRLGKNEEATDHFERITSYSHRYPPEFIEPDYEPDERLPRRPDGTTLDPFALTHVDSARCAYFAHLFLDLPPGSELADLIQLARRTERHSIARIFGLAQRIRCSPTPAELIGGKQ